MARELDQILQSNELRACVVLRPNLIGPVHANCQDQCQYQGPTFRILKLFTEHLDPHLQLKIIPISWAQQFQNEEGKILQEESYTPYLLQNETCDVFAGHLTKLEWREKKMHIIPLFQGRMMIMIHKRSKKLITQPKHLAGKKTLINKATSYESWVLNQNQTSLRENPILFDYDSTEKSLSALENEEIDFTIVDSDIAMWYTHKKGGPILSLFPVGKTEELGWGLRKTDTQLIDKLYSFFQLQKNNPHSLLNQIWEEEYGLTLSFFEYLIKFTLTKVYPDL